MPAEVFDSNCVLPTLFHDKRASKTFLHFWIRLDFGVEVNRALAVFRVHLELSQLILTTPKCSYLVKYLKLFIERLKHEVHLTVFINEARTLIKQVFRVSREKHLPLAERHLKHT